MKWEMEKNMSSMDIVLVIILWIGTFNNQLMFKREEYHLIGIKEIFRTLGYFSAFLSTILLLFLVYKMPWTYFVPILLGAELSTFFLSKFIIDLRLFTILAVTLSIVTTVSTISFIAYYYEDILNLF